MNDNLYNFTVPIYIKSLGGLLDILQKAEEFVKQNGLDEEVFLQERLAPDMWHLAKQVARACGNAEAAALRLSGMEVVKHADDEKTFAELYTRISQTLDFLRSISKESFEGAEKRKIDWPYSLGKHILGFDYAREHALPNFFFHLVIAYGIIRHKGVPIGKADYLNELSLRDN